MITSLILLFSGCSKKEIFVKELFCVEQQILNPLDEVTIRVHKDDLEVATEYKNEIDARFNFYENQVKNNNNLCKEKKE